MHAQTATHASLLTRIRDEADTGAWEEFEARYGRLLRGFARQRGLQAADCEDVAQEVMLSLSKALPGFSYDPARGKFRSYLKTATLHAIFRRERQRRGEVALDPIEEIPRCSQGDPVAEEAWEREWQRYHIDQAMRTLRGEFSRSACEAFRRYAIEGNDARQTAEELGLSVNQVYKAKSKILKRLEEVIAIQVEEEG